MLTYNTLEGYGQISGHHFVILKKHDILSVTSQEDLFQNNDMAIISQHTMASCQISAFAVGPLWV